MSDDKLNLIVVTVILFIVFIFLAVVRTSIDNFKSELDQQVIDQQLEMEKNVREWKRMASGVNR